jgi:ABC-type glycerol-3-phosphate transport system substrate-binding protein
VLVAVAATSMTATLVTSTSAFGAAVSQRVANVSGDGCSSGSVNLTFWSGVTGINSAVVLFNKTHPGICVHWLNEGPTVFAKLLDAMKTGTGAPDITQFNY